jgi:hypothetical protein
MKAGRWVLAALVASSSLAIAGEAPKKEEKPKPKAYMKAEEAGVDVRIQGEYAGDKFGGQVIALGKEQYTLVLFPGGLPGAGADMKAKVEVKGRQEGNGAKFEGKVTATADGEKLVGKDASGQAFELKRTERRSPSLGMPAPAGATILFDGSNVDQFKPGARMSADKLLEAASSPTTKGEWKDFTMHLEFWLPYMPDASGQGRANSGVYIQGRYELQVLDSFGLKGVDNECGGIYKNASPSVNMCLPPLLWQTYDIDFTAAKFEGEKKVADAVVTIKHNGVTIHDNQKLSGPTPGGPKSDAKKFPESTPGPLYLQNHGNPVMYRNIWVVEKK